MYYLQLLEQGWFRQLVFGLWMTLQISVCSYFLGMAVGFGVARLRLSKNWGAQLLAKAYADAIRSVPELLLIIIIYFTGASAINRLLREAGVAQFEISAFAAAVIALAVVQGGYQSEVLRGAFLSVPKGYLEAATALGLTPAKRFLLVTAPILFKAALPGLGNLWLAVLKESTLVSVVGFSELVAVGKAAAGSTKEYFFFYTVTALFFLALTAVSTLAIRRLEWALSPELRAR